jgi:hypothetical protein
MQMDRNPVGDVYVGYEKLRMPLNTLYPAIDSRSECFEPSLIPNHLQLSSVSHP